MDSARVVREFDPRQLDRRMLPDLRRLERQLPNRRRPYHDPAELVSRIVTMCQAVGIDVHPQDFLKHRTLRLVWGKNRQPRRERAPLLEEQFRSIYVGLRMGALHPIFLEVLAKCGWYPQGRVPKPTAVATASQVSLRLP